MRLFEQVLPGETQLHILAGRLGQAHVQAGLEATQIGFQGIRQNGASAL